MGVRELRIADATPGELYEVTIPERGRPLLLAHAPEPAPRRRAQLPDRLVLLDQRRPRRLLRGGGAGARPARAARVQGADGRPDLRRRVGAEAAQEPAQGPGRRSTSATGATPPTRSCSRRARRSSAATTTSSGTTSPSRRCTSRISWQRYAPDNGVALRRALRRLPGGAEPGRRALDARSASRRCRSSSPTRARTARATATRTPRSPPRRSGRTSRQWAAGLDGPGVLVLPQPLLKAGGSKTDRTLVDFKESDRLAAIFERALGGETADGKPHDIMILTGDIHTGRVSSAEIVGLPGTIYELVASPASLVTPYLPPWGHKPSELPDRLTINKRVWTITGHRRLTPDRRQQRRPDQDRARPQRPLPLHAPAVARAAVHRRRPPHLRAQGRQGRPADPRPTRTRAPLRRTRCCGTPRATRTTHTSRTGPTATRRGQRGVLRRRDRVAERATTASATTGWR